MVPPTTRHTAVVTGATRGIGKATAVALARLGYDVAITGRTRDPGGSASLREAAVMPEVAAAGGSLAETAAEIEAVGRRCIPIVLDLLDADRLEPAATEAIEGLGHVDVLVNNAIYVGPHADQLFVDHPAEELARRVFGNITAQLLFMRPIVAHMAGRGRGVIGDMTSGAGFNPPPAAPGRGGWSLIYGVTKAGFHRIAQQLAIEHPDLHALNLQPGAVLTERVVAAGEKLAFVARHGAPVDVVGTTVARVVDQPGQWPSGSTVEVQDVARAWGLLPPA